MTALPPAQKRNPFKSKKDAEIQASVRFRAFYELTVIGLIVALVFHTGFAYVFLVPALFFFVSGKSAEHFANNWDRLKDR